MTCPTCPATPDAGDTSVSVGSSLHPPRSAAASSIGAAPASAARAVRAKVIVSPICGRLDLPKIPQGRAGQTPARAKARECPRGRRRPPGRLTA
ncbi:hypothetical protein GWI34_24895 [Actinomadura sp. DSM 109109]|nr:hypothetical protein [Actinomadura lepetitiana]